MSVLELLRRFVVVAALGLWLGGFTVYTAFVIRIGHRQIPGGRFGFVTGEVTSVLDILGAIAAGVAILNLVLGWRHLGRGVRWTALATTVALSGALAADVLTHAQLNRVLDYQTHAISDFGRFETLHERYELFATIAWGAGLLHLLSLLAGWRAVDRAGSSGVA
jgi:hypothetical protein